MLALCLGGVLVAWLVLRTDDAAPPRGIPGEPAPAEVGRARPAIPSEIPAAARGPLPASLRGSVVDGALDVDGAGHLVPGPGLLQLFDYFLSASGEEPPAVIRGRILLSLRGSLPSPAAAEAELLLEQYLAYRESARELTLAGVAPPDLERRIQWLRELRRDHFPGPVADALFAESEAAMMLRLQEREVMLRDDLSESERANHLRAIEERLPENVRETRRASRAPARSRREVMAIRAAGGSEEEVFAAREREFGREAAERLAELDRARALDAAAVRDEP